MTNYEDLKLEQQIALELSIKKSLPMKEAISEAVALLIFDSEAGNKKECAVIQVDYSDKTWIFESFKSKEELYERYVDDELDYEGFRDELWNQGFCERDQDTYILVRFEV